MAFPSRSKLYRISNVALEFTRFVSAQKNPVGPNVVRSELITEANRSTPSRNLDYKNWKVVPHLKKYESNVQSDRNCK